jgi:Rha family phage regulatory protein
MKEVEAYQHYPVVVIEETQALTTSLNVAEYFGKEHRKVCRDIENLLASEAKLGDFWTANFGRSDYVDSRGKVQRMFTMTKSGFALLTMGYTGPKALRFKVAYINQFDAMEHWIKGPEQHKLFCLQADLIEAQAMKIRLITRKANKISDKEKREMVDLWRQDLKIADRMCRSVGTVKEHLAAARKAGLISEVRKVKGIPVS